MKGMTMQYQFLSDDDGPVEAPAGSVRRSDSELAVAREQLRAVTVVLDRLWQDSRESRTDGLSLHLGEATHSTHRALNALDEVR
jgi:hypothetical protein